MRSPLPTEFVSSGRLPLLWCLIAFILTFFVTRTVVRYIRAHADNPAPRKWWQPRNIGHGSLHIHHVVIGIVLVMVSGVTMVTLAVDGGVPEFTVAAIVFGIGAALVLDEFALILHLSDVYWAEDGRTSVDAVFVAVAVAGLLVLGFNPLSFFDITVWRDDQDVTARIVVVALALVTLAMAVIVLLKGKVWTGLVGMFITPLLVIGAIRLSRPHAPWARWRYTSRPRKMHKALERERWLRRPVVRAKLWLQDAIAGMPKFPDDAAVDQQLDREIHAAPAPPDRIPTEVA
ncbi:membrane protein [Mycolicibacterium llatzerense]|uniref:Membrane protein n=1 Tax=Mycolicibacterium llatzerense TaxID=280871 RepID=A0A0D1JRB0_9MYCO|nr:membrane protein [Mycolicibacterium llatzerense]